MKAFLLLAEGFEEVEALCPVDWLRRAGITVVTLGLGGTRIRGAHDIVVEADAALEDWDGIPGDAVIVPGGQPGTKNIAASKAAGDLVLAHAEAAKLVAAICAAPGLVLGPLGLLRGKKFSGFPGTEGQVVGAEFASQRVIVDGNLITAQAAGSALEFSAAIVEFLAGTEAAKTLRERTYSA